jgi:transposase-like protein
VEAIETELIKDGRKHDECGRRIVSAEERARLLAAYESSGLTQKEYARREGIKFATFTGWLMRHRRGKSAGAAVSFRELVVGASAPVAASLEVRLPDGLIVRGHHATEVAALIRALRA